MFCMLKKKKIYLAYVLKHNSNREKQVLLLYSNDSKSREMVLSFSKKILFPLLRWKRSKNHSDFYFLSCLHFFVTKNICESHKKVCENKDFCNVAMPSKDTKLL